MSWLFSQALVAAYSADTCLDGEPSAPSNGNPIQLAYCAPDKMTAFSRLFRFGMMFEPLTEDHGAALLTWFLAGFRARTFRLQERAQELTANAPDSGGKWRELSVRYDRDSCSWRTHRYLWEEVLPWSSVTLPPWGMTRNGHVLAHPTSERPISATVSGLWQTPVADDACNRANGKWNSRGEPKLSAQVMIPTPTVCGNYNRKGLSKTSGDGLATFVQKWPTPTKSDHKGSGPTMVRSDGKMRGDRLDYATERTADGFSTGGQLNPTWVEWLMGWPLGWTDLKPLEMARFREWQQQHFGY